MKRGKKIVLFIILLLAVYFSIVAALIVTSSVRELPPSAEVDVSESANWMEGLEDGVPLSKISLPGTHDSGTTYISLSYSSQCQNTTISEQLMQGFRVLDIRLVVSEDKNSGEKRLCIMHGISHAYLSDEKDAPYLYLEDVLEQVYTFLDEHPTETVLCMFASEKGHADVSEIAEMLQSVLQESQEHWYLKNQNPSLWEVRGKAILATRFGDINNVGESDCGLSFVWNYQGQYWEKGDSQVKNPVNTELNIWVQNHSGYRPNAKWRAFGDTMENCHADEQTFSANYLSTASGKVLIPCPKENARILNQRFLATELNRQSYGIIFVDFGNAELAQHIYETNG